VTVFVLGNSVTMRWFFDAAFIRMPMLFSET
jgi:hypothetical protein